MIIFKMGIMSKEKIEKILNLVKELDPKDITTEDIDDIIYSAYVKKEILLGLEDSKNGRVSSYAEVKKRLSEKWLQRNIQ